MSPPTPAAPNVIRFGMMRALVLGLEGRPARRQDHLLHEPDAEEQHRLRREAAVYRQRGYPRNRHPNDTDTEGAIAEHQYCARSCRPGREVAVTMKLMDPASRRDAEFLRGDVGRLLPRDHGARLACPAYGPASQLLRDHRGAGTQSVGRPHVASMPPSRRPWRPT